MHFFTETNSLENIFTFMDHFYHELIIRCLSVYLQSSLFDTNHVNEVMTNTLKTYTNEKRKRLSQYFEVDMNISENHALYFIIFDY